MTSRRHQVACALGALLGMLVLAGYASAIKCTGTATPWNGGSNDFTCTFANLGPGLPNATVHGSSLSGFDRGNPVLLADLIAVTNIPAGRKGGARAVGIDNAGQVISTCDTTTDYSTASGVTVADASGCQNAAGHHLYLSLEP